MSVAGAIVTSAERRFSNEAAAVSGIDLHRFSLQCARDSVFSVFLKRQEDSLSADNFINPLKGLEVLEQYKELSCVNQKLLDPEACYGIICGYIRELSGLP